MPGTSPEFSAKDFDIQFNINARGMWLCQRAEIIQLLKQEPIQPEGSPSPNRGTIANVASMAALRVYDNLPSYCASKFAILGFTKADAMRYGREHIRINAVCPGVIKTPLLGEVRDDDTTNIAEMTKEMALGRQGQPEEVAEGLYWLSSPQSSFVTGISLPVNGGQSSFHASRYLPAKLTFSQAWWALERAFPKVSNPDDKESSFFPASSRCTVVFIRALSVASGTNKTTAVPAGWCVTGK